MPAALEPLLTDSTWGATALLQGAPIYAPWYRDDVEPLNADVHRIQLSLLTPADLRRAGVTRFWLTPESYHSLNRTLGGILREEGRALSAVRVDSWPNHGSATKAAIVWGRVEVTP